MRGLRSVAPGHGACENRKAVLGGDSPPSVSKLGRPPVAPRSSGFATISENLMRVEPLGDKVVVKRMEAESTTSGGIVLPDTAQERPQQGRVLSVGDGRLLADGSRAGHQVADGDRVLFNKYAGTEVIVDGEELLIMDEHEILAVVA